MKKAIHTMGIFECIMIVIMMLFTVVMAVDTFSGVSSIEEYQNTAAQMDEMESIYNDPTQWVILSVSDDYSEAEVLYPDGNIWVLPIYECYNEDYNLCVVLETGNGELHEFAVWVD